MHTPETPSLTAFQILELQLASTEAAVASAVVLSRGQRGEIAFDVSSKADQSLLSQVDGLSEAAAKEAWARHVSYPILGEETGVSGGSMEGVRIIGMNDPVDGTRPLVIGAHTSTAMGGAYDLLDRRFVASSVVHPTSNTLVEACNGTTWVSHLQFTEDGYELHGTRTGEVWDGPLAGSVVLVDNFSPFSRGQGEETRVITNPRRLGRFLSGLLTEKAIPFNFGSNGYHQMLLAKGGDNVGEKLAGAVMMAQGGVWDAIGLPAVENAGGFARAFYVEQNGTLDERAPQDPFTWDILVLGNNKATTDALSGVVEKMF
ncbi:MAG TPA: hypothetical protein VJP80_07450 [Candidatus Saccharimonadales bacterium]|nr:hypothetical protein [Candidatus Saccharimonadales bacterium]